ncbi:MAG: hypothetical protein WC984_07680 [Bacteroidales bacterium]
MNKIINKLFLATVLVALVLTSCTDEADILDNKPIKNKKTGEEIIRRPYYEYEQNDYTEEEVITLISDFSTLIKDAQSSVSYFDIPQAVLAMETYFNYAIVDKQTEFDASISYEKQFFSFTVSVDQEIRVDLLELREAYIEFIENILSDMEDRYLQFSDLYVLEIDELSVTFALEMAPYSSDAVDYNELYFREKVVKTVNDIDQILGYTEYPFSTDWVNVSNPYVDKVIRSACKKTIYNTVLYDYRNITVDINEYIIYQTDDILIYDPSYFIYLRFAEEDLKPLVVNTILKSQEAASNLSQSQEILIDIEPTVHEIQSPSGDPNLYRKKLHPSSLFFARMSSTELREALTYLNFYDLNL